MDSSDVCIVVVFYNPSRTQIEQYDRLALSCNVVGVDNSIGNSDISNMYYIPLHKNEGIAVAQNIGIQYALKHNYSYVLLMDQDSIIDSNYVDDITKEFIRIKSVNSSIGFLGPIFIDEKTKIEYKNYIGKDEEYCQVGSVIASGSLISTEVLRIVGGMDENMFIDLVDFEWGWRATSKGFTGFISRRIKMYHTIGQKYYNWHGFVLGTSAPRRYYFQYRNTLWLIKRRYVPFKWKVKSIVRRLIDVFLVPIASDQGFSCLKYMVMGIYDGLQGNPAIKVR